MSAGVIGIIVGGVVFYLAGFVTGASVGAWSVKRNIGRVLAERYNAGDKISVREVLGIADEA